MNVARYLGAGFGLGVHLDERGRLRGVSHHGRDFGLRELTDADLALTAGPRFAGRFATPEPNGISLPDELRYEFEGACRRRVVTLSPGLGSLRIDDHAMDPSSGINLSLQGTGHWETADESVL